MSRPTDTASNDLKAVPASDLTYNYNIHSQRRQTKDRFAPVGLCA